MNTLKNMNTRHIAIFGMAALGLTLAIPAQAAPRHLEGAFVVAKRESRDQVRQDPRDARGDARRDRRRDAEQEEPRGYGYGYERRQEQDREGDDRRRGRR